MPEWVWLAVFPYIGKQQLLETSGFFKDLSFDQSRAHGTRYLMLARMDALWTARKAIQIGILVDTHPFSVDIILNQQAHPLVPAQQSADTSTPHSASTTTSS
ncbi:hypothetical protein BASA82_001257 [Batrachochytrium salamandrivorans]|nr:hypothetical protein BASA82_001257 [Batrachochytrium salamandrivorans]